MKIDLDELERKAKRWDTAIGKDDEADARLAHIAANSPPVILAMIARIRELEAALLRAGHAFAGILPPPDVRQFVALLERGAVLA